VSLPDRFWPHIAITCFCILQSSFVFICYSIFFLYLEQNRLKVQGDINGNACILLNLVLQIVGRNQVGEIRIATDALFANIDHGKSCHLGHLLELGDFFGQRDDLFKGNLHVD